MQDAIRKERFNPILPPDQRAKRTVMLFLIDDHIYHLTEGEIKEEIILENRWVKEGIDSLYKSPNKNIIKIQWKQASEAQTAIERGILAYSMRIPEYNIRADYISIITCLRCYAINSHLTSSCPMDRNYKICTECGKDYHTWKNCESNTKKSVNCAGNHRALQQQAAATSSRVTAGDAPVNVNLEKDTTARILVCILHAHLHNVAEPDHTTQNYIKYLSRTTYEVLIYQTTLHL